jgi:hypothetical protein
VALNDLTCAIKMTMATSTVVVVVLVMVSGHGSSIVILLLPVIKRSEREVDYLPSVSGLICFSSTAYL